MERSRRKTSYGHVNPTGELTREGEAAKKFVQSIHEGAKFIWRRDMPIWGNYLFDLECQECQIINSDGRYSLACKWSGNENDAWIDARTLIHKNMIAKLES